MITYHRLVHGLGKHNKYYTMEDVCRCSRNTVQEMPNLHNNDLAERAKVNKPDDKDIKDLTEAIHIHNKAKAKIG